MDRTGAMDVATPASPGSPAAISVVVVDDHAMVAESLAAGLNARPDLTVVAVTGSVNGAVAAVTEHHPAVVLMDYRLPDGTGTEGAAAVKTVSPDSAVLIITAEAGPDVVAEAAAYGCAGLIAKGQSLDEVAAGIRTADRGGTVFDPALLTEAVRRRRDPGADVGQLTRRESEVLELLAVGASTADIAQRLVLSTHTVRNHVRNITAKLGARSRLEAVAIARREGLVAAGPRGGIRR